MANEFHYVRTTGVEGGVEAVDGPAIGIGLDELLEAGLNRWFHSFSVVVGSSASSASSW